MTSPGFAEQFPKVSCYVSHICRKHGLLKRTVNSIRSDVQGRMKALMELKKTELKQTDIRIGVKEEKIAGIKGKLDALKPKAAANRLTEKELKKYRGLKKSLYWQKNKLNRLRQHKEKLEYQIDNKIYSMCYGSKVMFRKQYQLSENGYKTHEKWHNDFVKTLRKENRYCKGNRACDKYVCLDGLDFKYMKDELIAILQSYGRSGKGDCPLTYRFHRAGNRWYLQVMFGQSFVSYRTVPKYGAIGLGYNDGFIELSETDGSGNLVRQRRYDLRHHGTGNRAEAEIRDVIADIVRDAESRCKDIAVEDLDFRRAKARQSSSSREKGKRYNRMLHLFDYSRYKQTLFNAGFNHRVNIVTIDPKNTSKIGKQKYCGSRKLNVHQAASYVIARRGQGYLDRLVV